MTRPGTLATYVIRRPWEDDLGPIEDMWARCGRLSRLTRFHSPIGVMPASYLREVFRRPAQSLVAVGDLGRRSAGPGIECGPPVHALASLFDCGEGQGELGVLVEDAHQGRRIGSTLVAALVADSWSRGVRRVTAVVLADNERALRLIRRIPGERRLQMDGPEITATIWPEPAHSAVPECSPVREWLTGCGLGLPGPM